MKNVCRGVVVDSTVVVRRERTIGVDVRVECLRWMQQINGWLDNNTSTVVVSMSIIRVVVQQRDIVIVYWTGGVFVSHEYSTKFALVRVSYSYS